MGYSQYHSGTEETFVGEPLDPSSLSVARGNFFIHTTEDLEKDEFLESGSPSVSRAILAAPKPLLKIRFETTQYPPNHLVTLRNSQDGWTKDIFGIYRFGGWEFFLEKSSYLENLEFKFVLDLADWMNGFNLNISTHADSFFTDAQIQFPVVPSRYKHGYDNFHIDSTRIAQDGIPGNTQEAIEYDVIVIGSGIGGGILADALSDSGLKTLVLEAGGLNFPTHTSNLPGDWSRLATHHQVGHFNNEPGSSFLLGVHLSLGGRSNYWSGLIPRMRDWELQSWPQEIRDFFKIQNGYNQAEKLMRKGKTLGPFQDSVVKNLSVNFGDWIVEDLPHSRHQPNLSDGNIIENVLESSTGTFSTTDLLLTSMAFDGASGRKNLTINLGHLVTKIESDGSKVKAVICQDLIGNVTRRYKGKIIVLAAGSLESPKIALNSNLSDPNNKIGVGLTDHPAFFSAEYIIPDGNPFGGPDKHAKVFMAKRDATISNHPFNIEILINPVYWNLRKPDDDILQAPNTSRIKLTFPFYSQLDDDNFVRSNGIGKKLSVKVNRNQTGVSHFGAAQQIRNNILSQLGIPFTPNEGMGYGNEGTVHHAGGTLRMSGNGSGVVDTNLKFESYDNLYCADPSVWPFIPAANPALTLAALSLRLAKTISSLS
jgi:choline dehydrogenase-like flavoprotein